MGALAWTEAINTGSEPDSTDLLEARGAAKGSEAEAERKVDGEDKVNGEPTANDASKSTGENKPETQNKPNGEDEAKPQDGKGSKKEDNALDEYRKKKIEECQASLDRAAGWESFVLDARCGMRVQTGVETVRWYRRRMGWA